jgi:hypothetical protein
LNSIAQVKTVAVENPNRPANAMMMAVNIADPATAEEFVQHVAEQFIIHRMLAPPDTSMLLITLIGGLSAERFAKRWTEIEQGDEVIRAFLAQMTVAEVIQGTKTGQELSKASLLRPQGGPASSPKP